MPPTPPDTDDLLCQVSQGDDGARNQLLLRHQARLRKMIACRLHRQLSPRVDPSDVVQEVLAEAARRLPDYLKARPMAFYPWLRQIAQDRLVDLHRRHVQARRRSVRREEPLPLPLPDESAVELAGRLLWRGSNPSARLHRRERSERLRRALAQLGERDRDLLVLRHLEELSIRDIAGVLGISEGAVKVRHVRALQRLRALLGDDFNEETP